MRSGYQFISPVNEGDVSDGCYQQISGEEMSSLLDLLVRARKRVALFIKRDAGRSQQHISMALEHNRDGGWLLLDITPDQRFNQQVLQSGMSLLTRLDEGKIQVDFEQIAVVDRDGIAALRCKLPEKIIKIQRRQARRVEAGSDVVFDECSLLAGDSSAQVVVHDLSDMGIGLILKGGNQPAPAKGQILDGCVLTLSDFGSMTVMIEVKGTNSYQDSDGCRVVTIGGDFVNLPASSHALLQRYIFRRDLEGRNRLDELDNLDHSLASVGEPVVRERL